ncbi:disulfide bond formation protein B [Phaeobacter inhibens]|uniref:disulfide bond formation protein B n=1 Tax=Phaeobacter inhibens TaxID=221822 RepID=UPI000C9D1177|nr:disulfide bond formation protein B [Phaeobacter inhibens]AUQ54330.1 Disulfide bond formation protein DsbB [Phaeobacter inhibens]AUQ78346.1 Disulfide bond formation protein DsbB [Phaeobacter inhibens]AUR15505.1 Disulfide bond formation protein DsbB [Phaeobacter inhibens]UWR54562.1 disulfide bond formation protein B [Phaeobacter inhibens]UWR66300.1 disulfide bond formation protein B [Phaeobacter inhibens]
MSRFLILIATAGSAALLLGAFGFQYLGEMPPCKLCIWQRYPHGAAIVIGMLALMVPMVILPYLGALAALATAGIGAYHSGVERGWWEGPNSCTSGPIGNLSGEDLMQQIMSAPLVRCDDVPWELFSLSMASWNAIASLFLAVLWVAAANHMRKNRI